MQGKLVEWLVGILLSKLDSEVASRVLVSLLRGGVGALKDVAARTPSKLDDQVVAKAGEIVEEIAQALSA